MESDDKTAKETTLGRLIRPLLSCTLYTTPWRFSHIYLMSIKQASQANKLNTLWLQYESVRYEGRFGENI